MQHNKLTKKELADQLQTSRLAVERLLDPNNMSITLQTIGRVVQMMGKHLYLQIA